MDEKIPVLMRNFIGHNIQYCNKEKMLALLGCQLQTSDYIKVVLFY
jgi:hypothetical protein